MTTGERQVQWLLPTLSGYAHASVGRDVLAGLSAGAVVIPQAMAYATIANLPVQVGLYTCIVPMFVYALLGGSRAMSVSTTSTIATLTATTLVSAGAMAGSEDIPLDLITLTLLVGIILLLARLLRLGSLIQIINRPTIIGIQVGVGATVAIGQLPKLLGQATDPTGEGFVRSLSAVIAAAPSGNWATALLSSCSIAALLAFKRYYPKLPAPLIVVAAGILLAAIGLLPAAGVALIAPVPQGLPMPGLPTFAHIGALLPGALAISVMAFLESAAVARGMRDPGEPPVDANRELFATAAANVAGSFFSTIPAAGGFSQSAVNKNAGARSQLSSLVTVALAVVVGLFLGPVLSLLPMATLASLVFVAVIGLIDVKGLVALWRISRRDFWIAAATAVIGMTAGLLTAVAVGVGATLILVLQALARVQVSSERLGEVFIVRLGGPLYTANAESTEQEILRQVSNEPRVRVVVFDASKLSDISVTVLEALADLDHELAAIGIQLRIAALAGDATAIAARDPWYASLAAAGRAFPTVDAAASAPLPHATPASDSLAQMPDRG
jgi:SulP family sulfate permease